jgi:predicted outer membrane repeat protein
MRLRIRRQRSLLEMLERRQLLSTVYVDAGATGSTHDGMSWSTAFTDLQSALTTAASGDQIDVAGGTYKPTSGTDPKISFDINNGVAVYGGYAGAAASDPGARNPAQYPTILSGDIGQLGFVQDNSYEVVTAGNGSVVDGLTITDGYAFQPEEDTAGGGMRVGSATINDCIFIDNIAPQRNSAGSGGALYIDGNATITNCQFLGNSAQSAPFELGTGGAIAGGGSANIVNSIFVGNSAGQGGAISLGSGTTVTNCDFVDNTASETGGAVFGSLSLNNCIFWGNQSPNSPEISTNPDSQNSADPTSYSDVEGGFLGSGNIDADPQFTRDPSPGTDGVWGTADDDYGNLQLQQTSPGIDAGDNTNMPTNITADIAGNPRFIDVPTIADTGNGTAPIVDMGAYETIPPVAAIAGGPYTVVQGQNITLDGRGLSNIPGDLQYAWDFTGNGQFTDATGAAPVFSAASLAAPATLPIELQVTNADGQTSVSSTSVNVLPATIYVDANAPGSNDGSDWKDAYTSLTDALSAAISGQTIEVAAGVYHATSGTDRTATFTLKDGVEIDGGYAGFGATNPDSRRLNPGVTVLDGEFSDSTRSNNTYHIVTGTDVDSTAVLDGFTIENGYASDSLGMGGGIYLNDSSPTIRNCVISNNFAQDGGGGIYDLNSSPTIINTEIESNSANGGGGGIRNEDSSPTLTNSEIIANYVEAASSDDFGGGMADYNGSAPVLDLTGLADDKAGFGGAVYDSSSEPQFSGCRIVNNAATAADGQGGAIFDVASDSQFTNCTFANNSAADFGGAISTAESSNLSITNSILWADKQASGSNELSISSSTVEITYSDVQGGYTGTGNINADPKFAALPGPGVDNLFGTSDDYFGDQRLLTGSPCIGTGQNSTGSTDMGYAAYSANPLIVSMQPTQTSIVSGQKIEFTLGAIAQSASDAVKSVTLYVDTNDDLTLDAGDAIAGKAKKTKSGWTVSVPSKDLTVGNVKFYAVATTKDGLTSNQYTRNSASVYVVGAGAVALGSLSAKLIPTKNPNSDKLKLVSSGAGSLKAIYFNVDTNNDGRLDDGDAEIYGGKATKWSGSFSVTPGVTYLFFAQAQGTDGLFSNAVATSVVAPS